MLTFYRGPDYVKLPRAPHKFIIQDLIPTGGLVNIYGKPKSHKSFAALGMGLAIANGLPDWNGYPVHIHGPVAYLQVDTPREEWADRIEKAMRSGYDTHNIHFADMLTVPYPFNIIDPEHFKELQERMNEIRPVLTIVDTLRESFAGDENESDAMRNVVTNIVAATRWDVGQQTEGRSAVILLSHARKDGGFNAGESDLMDDNRGSSYVPGRMDVIVKLTEHRMTYKGRAVKQASVSVGHDDQGFLIINGQSTKAEASLKVKELLKNFAQLREQGKVGKAPSMRGLSELLVNENIITGTNPKTGKPYTAESVRKWPEFIEAFKQMVGEDAGGNTPPPPTSHPTAKSKIDVDLRIH